MSFNLDSLKDIKYNMCDFDFIMDIRAPNQSFKNYIEKLKASGTLNSVLSYSTKPSTAVNNNSIAFPYQERNYNSITSYSYKDEPSINLYNGSDQLLHSKHDEYFGSLNVQNIAEFSNVALTNELISQIKKVMVGGSGLEEKVGINSEQNCSSGQSTAKAISKIKYTEEVAGPMYDKNVNLKSTDEAIAQLLSQRRNATLKYQQQINEIQITQNAAKDSNIPCCNNSDLASQVASFNAQQIGKASPITSLVYNTDIPLSQQLAQHSYAMQSNKEIYNMAHNYQKLLQQLSMPPPQQNLLLQFPNSNSNAQLLSSDAMQQLYSQQQNPVNGNQFNSSYMQLPSNVVPPQQMCSNSSQAYSNGGLRQPSNPPLQTGVQSGVSLYNGINNLSNVQQMAVASSHLKNEYQINEQQENGFGFKMLQQQMGTKEGNRSTLALKNNAISSGTKMLAKFPYERNFNSPFGSQGELSLKIMEELTFIEHNKGASGWSFVINKEGKTGYVPFNYLTLVPASTNLPWLQNKVEEVELPPVLTKVIKPYKSAYDSTGGIAKGLTEYKCEICNKLFNGRQPYSLHIASKAHMQEVEITQSFKYM